MPPVILWALGAIGGAIATRFLYREARRINAELHPEQSSSEREMGKLERDPQTGVYRPK